MITERTATTKWMNTTSKSYGVGMITTDSKAFDKLHVSYKARFENEPGTNPEELIGAAQSSCLTINLTRLLEKAGYSQVDIKTHCTIKFDVDRVMMSDVFIDANVPNMDVNIFEEFVNKAKELSIITQVLKVKTKIKFKFSSKALSNDGIAILGRSLSY